MCHCESENRDVYRFVAERGTAERDNHTQQGGETHKEILIHTVVSGEAGGNM